MNKTLIFTIIFSVMSFSSFCQNGKEIFALTEIVTDFVTQKKQKVLKIKLSKEFIYFDAMVYSIKRIGGDGKRISFKLNEPKDGFQYYGGKRYDCYLPTCFNAIFPISEEDSEFNFIIGITRISSNNLTVSRNGVNEEEDKSKELNPIHINISSLNNEWANIFELAKNGSEIDLKNSKLQTKYDVLNSTNLKLAPAFYSIDNGKGEKINISFSDEMDDSNDKFIMRGITDFKEFNLSQVYVALNAYKNFRPHWVLKHDKYNRRQRTSYMLTKDSVIFNIDDKTIEARINSNGELVSSSGKFTLYDFREDNSCVWGDCVNGYGIYLWKQKNSLTRAMYEGNISNEQPSGYGLKQDVAGSWWYKGNFQEGAYNGKGYIIKIREERQYEGTFKNGRAHGLGVASHISGGNIQDGLWENGRFQEQEINPCKTECQKSISIFTEVHGELEDKRKLIVTPPTHVSVFNSDNDSAHLRASECVAGEYYFIYSWNIGTNERETISGSFTIDGKCKSYTIDISNTFGLTFSVNGW